jgi:son of sevenless
MLPILHGLSLLQAAVRQKRTRHFSSSSACIVSCTRSVLAGINCLARDSPTIQRFPMLYTERKEVLAALSSFVAHTREAAQKEDESERDAETEKMLRSGGQLFARLRRFLAIVSQLGIPIPDVEEAQSELGSTDTSYSLEESPPLEPPARDRQLTLTPRAKSLGDLRSRARPPGVSHKRNDSISSTASSSLASSPILSTADPDTGPPHLSRPAPGMVFPSGSCSSREVLLALRSTHDEYISSIGAFIGQVHSHARASYAAIHGHMYAFMRNIIEAVCRLLVLIGAVMAHPEISPYRRANLRDSKETLYSASSALAESVRRLTSDREVEASMTEEEEKQLLLQCATAALKIGSDAVAVTKMCLNRPTFTVQIPDLEHTVSLRIDPNDLANIQERDVTGLNTLDSVYKFASDEDEDMTVHVRAAARSTPVVDNMDNNVLRDPKLTLTVKVDGPLATPTLTSTPTTPTEEVNTQVPVEVTPPSPTTSFAPTEKMVDDDRTTWNGSVRSVVSSNKSEASPTEEKILRGDLSIVPRETVADLARADPRAYLFLPDHLPSDVAYNNEGHLVGATLNMLVEKLTPHHMTVDHAFMAVFFMTFRMFATPRELLGAIIARYNLVPPPGLSGADEKMWQNSKGMPTRLRVANLVKTWLEIHWRPETDNAVLDTLDNFTREALVPLFPKMVRIVELINEQRQASAANTRSTTPTMGKGNNGRPRSSSVATSPKEERARDPGMSLNPSVNVSEIPRPLMTKTLLSTLRAMNFKSVNVTDFDPLELARQMTIKECQIYCGILPEEILESGQEGAKPAVHVKQLTTLSTMITGWVAESILDEADTKKRTALVKFFIKLADRCTTLSNFSTSRSILAALDSSTISRLSQTWTVSECADF